MDAKQLQQYIDQAWDDDIVPQLVDYIRIPNKSPMFDADWVQNGHMERAVQQLAGWARKRPIPGLKLEVVKLENRTPLIFIEIPAAKEIQGLPDLSGKTIAELWDQIFRGDVAYAQLREHLKKRYPGIRFVPWSEFGNIHGPKQREILEKLPDTLREIIATTGADEIIIASQLFDHAARLRSYSIAMAAHRS